MVSSKLRFTTDDLRSFMELPDWHRPDEAAIRDFLRWVDNTIEASPDETDGLICEQAHEDDAEHMKPLQAAVCIGCWNKLAAEVIELRKLKGASVETTERRECQCATYCMLAVGAKMTPEPICRGLPGERSSLNGLGDHT